MKGPDKATFDDVSRIVLSKSKKAARAIAISPASGQSTGVRHQTPLCTGWHLMSALSTGACVRVDERAAAGAP